MPGRKSRLIGCLLGGAIGDAMGYPVEFMRYADIARYFGGAGVRDLSASTLVSDDTQMTLFTAEGLLNANRLNKPPVKSVYRSYLRWYYTQSKSKMPGAKYEGGLLNEPKLFATRAPGSTCLSSLSSGKMGTLADPINHSRGCGGVMRVAPCAVFPQPFDLGCRVAAITHGHPGGYISAGALAELLQKLYYGQSLPDAVDDLIVELDEIENAESTRDALQHAVELEAEGRPCAPTIKELGEGWVGEARRRFRFHRLHLRPDHGHAAGGRRHSRGVAGRGGAVQRDPSLRHTPFHHSTGILKQNIEPPEYTPGALFTTVYSATPSRFFMVFSTALRMFSYPVQRHRCPERSFLSSSRV